MKRRELIKMAAAAGVGAVALSGFSSMQARADSDVPRHLADPAHPTVLEQKHVPFVKAPSKVVRGKWFNVKVKVGFKLPHPSTAGHWIKDIKLLVNGKDLVELDNEVGGITSPDGYFTIRLYGPADLAAIATCNLHGSWISNPVRISVGA